MHINSKHTDLVNADLAHSAQPADSADRVAVGPVVRSPSTSDRSAKVQISDVGRALAARDGDRASADLDAVRAASVRQLVLSGAYDTMEVIDAVARRLLASGDL